MNLSKTALVLGSVALVTTVATAVSMLHSAPARAQTAAPACTCSAPLEVIVSTLPTAPRAFITNCQCGAQSCAVLNSQVLQCSK